MNKRNFLKTGILGLGALALSKNVNGLEYYPKPSDKKWAVLYGTWCGTSRDAGIWISEGTGGIANVFDVRENPDLSSYDHLIIGGSIRSNIISDQLKDYLEKHRESTKGKVRGLYAVCGNMMQPVGDEQYKLFIHDQLAELTNAFDVPSHVFLGRITWGLMEPEVRERMQAIPNMKEYDNLKRSECMDFGKKILESTL